jgi:tellurium resistance protein TerD
MSVSLSKGGTISLTKASPGLSKVFVGLGWDARTTSGADFDLDAVVFILGSNGRVLNDQHFIFFNNLISPDGSVEHTGDNLTGDGEGDDEVINVNLAALSPAVDRVAVGVSIYDAAAQQLTFGQVQNAFVRVVNAETNAELARYDLSEDASVETAMLFGELYKDANGWSFRAVGQGHPGGLGGLASAYGVSV